MTAERIPKLLTIGEVARHLGVPVHRVAHVLDTRPHIRPRATAGGSRVYDAPAVAMIRHELSTIDARRASCKGGAR